LLSVQVAALTSGRVLVKLVDFGNNIECTPVDLFSANHLDTPTMAFLCKLDGADERPASSVVAVLNQYLSKVALIANFRQKLPTMYVVDLVDTRDGKNVRITDRLLVATSARVPPAADIALNVPETVYISSVSGECMVFAQLTKYEPSVLKQFNMRLNEHYAAHSVPAISRPQPGDFCCCIYSADNMYYRARVVREFGPNYLVCVFNCLENAGQSL
jgi:hypothetical protein